MKNLKKEKIINRIVDQIEKETGKINKTTIEILYKAICAKCNLDSGIQKNKVEAIKDISIKKNGKKVCRKCYYPIMYY